MAATAHPSGPSYLSTVFGASDSWLVITAVMFIFLGIAAIVEPAVAGLAVTALVGWLLILGGIVNAMEVFKGGGFARVMWQLFVALIYLVGGVFFLTHPLIGLGTLTLYLAGILLAEGVLKLIAFIQSEGEEGSAWLLLNAGVTVLLAAMIWIRWPSSSAWAIGTLVGINLLMSGCSRLMIGIGSRRFLA